MNHYGVWIFYFLKVCVQSRRPYTHVWRPEENVTQYLRMGLSLNLELQCVQEPSYTRSPIDWAIDMCAHTQLFVWVLGC